MTTLDPEAALEQQRIIWACYQYWATEPTKPEDRVVCYSWVLRLYRTKFGRSFHQSKLEHLARLGILEKADTSRGGTRRYYRITDPAFLTCR